MWMPSIKQVQALARALPGFLQVELRSPICATSAGNPADCAEERCGALNPFDTLPSLGRALRCLKALKAGAG